MIGLTLLLPACPSASADPLQTAGITTIGADVYPNPQKPVAGSQINWSRSLSTNLVSALPINEGVDANFYDAVTQQSYPALKLSGSPANALPPAWFTPAVSTNYPWAGPAVSNNDATAQTIQSPFQEAYYINNVTNGYSYAVLVQPLDTTTFGRIMDATGAAIITFYLNHVAGQATTTWRDINDGATNPPAPFHVNQWILLLCTVQQGLGVMYVNGTPVASATNVNLAESWSGQIGQLNYNTTGGNNPGSMMCNANFSSWWIWNNRVLTAQEAAQMYASPWAMFNSGAQKGFIKGTKVALGSSAVVSNVCFYSHAARGNLRLGLYDNNSPKNLLWQSGIITNTADGAWITAPIAAGTPASLVLTAGAYWLTWQMDTIYDVPSYTAGASGAGFELSQNFGSFPATLIGAQSTSENWSVFFNYIPPSAPTFAGLAFQPGGSLQLQLNGNTNVPYALQVSTNLTNWLPLNASGSLSNGLWLFSDTNSGASPGRFYRAVWP